MDLDKINIDLKANLDSEDLVEPINKLGKVTSGFGFNLSQIIYEYIIRPKQINNNQKQAQSEIQLLKDFQQVHPTQRAVEYIENMKKQVDYSDLLSRSNMVADIQHIQETARVEEVLLHAIPHLENNDSEEVSIEWFSHFQKHVKHATSENIKYVWSKLLAGEVNTPGSFSVSTLDTLSQLSTADAILFSKVCDSIIIDVTSMEDHFIPLNTIPLMGKKNAFEYLMDISYDEFSLLVDLNLFRLNSSDVTTYIKPSNQPQCIYQNKKYHLFIDNNSTLKIHAAFLTQQGKELFSLLTLENNDRLCTIFEAILKYKNIKYEIIV